MLNSLSVDLWIVLWRPVLMSATADSGINYIRKFKEPRRQKNGYISRKTTTHFSDVHYTTATSNLFMNTQRLIFLSQLKLDGIKNSSSGKSCSSTCLTNGPRLF